MKVKTKQNKTTKTKAELDFEQATQAFAIARSIYKANTAYDKASEAKRRVMIAKDALKQLNMGRYVATPGTYVNACKLSEEANLEDEVQLNTLLHNTALKSSCDVCARGALLLSAVRFRNDCIIEASGETSEDSFVQEFSDQQELIECAFELSVAEGNSTTWSARFLNREQARDPNKRLELILKNIIRNKGTFKDDQR